MTRIRAMTAMEVPMIFPLRYRDAIGSFAAKARSGITMT
jgi:hypothetical protein